MVIKSIELTNFRNFKKKKFSLENLNVIFGKNGTGKSSLVEAIHLTATTKSLRANYDKEMIMHGEELARIETEINKNSDDEKLEILITNSLKFQNSSKKTVKINKIPKTLNNFAGTLNVVTFTPLDLNEIYESPGSRRKYLDFVLTQTSREYRKSLTSLVDVIKNRNKVLEKIRDEGRGKEELKLWNQFLIKESNAVQQLRNHFFEETTQDLNKFGKLLNSSDYILEIKYNPSKVNDDLLSEYEQKEIYATQTLLGPHRDDFSIFWNKESLLSYGSRGYQRSSILALKLSELNYMQNQTGHRPLLLLDDIFSELDDTHKKQIFEILPKQQSIVTTTDRDFIQKNLSSYNLINLSE